MSTIVAEHALDVRVATEIFGHQIPEDWANRIAVPPYSSRIEHAWTVVAHLAQLGLTVSVVYVASAGVMSVTVDRGTARRLAEPYAVGGPEIAPRLICRAALEALEAVARGKEYGEIDAQARQESPESQK